MPKKTSKFAALKGITRQENTKSKFLTAYKKNGGDCTFFNNGDSNFAVNTEIGIERLVLYNSKNNSKNLPFLVLDLLSEFLPDPTLPTPALPRTVQPSHVKLEIVNDGRKKKLTINGIVRCFLKDQSGPLADISKRGFVQVIIEAEYLSNPKAKNNKPTYKKFEVNDENFLEINDSDLFPSFFPGIQNQNDGIDSKLMEEVLEKRKARENEIWTSFIRVNQIRDIGPEPKKEGQAETVPAKTQSPKTEEENFLVIHFSRKIKENDSELLRQINNLSRDKISFPTFEIFPSRNQELLIIQIPADEINSNPRNSQDADWKLHIHGFGQNFENFWNNIIVNKHYESLRNVKDGAPASFLPRLKQTENLWGIAYNVHDKIKNLRVNFEVANSDLVYGDSQQCSSGKACFSVASIQPIYSGEITAEFDRIKTHSGKPLKAVLRLQGIFEDRKFMENHSSGDFEQRNLYYGRFNDNPFLYIPFENERQSIITSTDSHLLRTVRNGSFDLEFGGEMKAIPAVDNFISIVPYKDGELFLQQVDINLHLPLVELRPGGQDDFQDGEYLAANSSVRNTNPCEVLGDELEILNKLDKLKIGDELERNIERLYQRRVPLVIDPSASKPINNPQIRKSLFLQVEEKTVSGATHTVKLVVKKNPLPPAKKDENTAQNAAVKVTKLMATETASTKMESAIILDSDPMIVAKVDFNSFSDIAPSADSTPPQIATWSNAAGWQIFSGTKPFDLILPPQGVGEEMEKAKNIDIGKGTDFRLSPPAKFELKPSESNQNYTEPPWNLRRLLGYDGRSNSGLQVKHISFELLYGLSCDSNYPFLRLAEIASRIGLIPGRLPKSAVNEIGRKNETEYKRSRIKWAITQLKFQSRIAIFEPWDSHQTGSLLLNENTICKIRKFEENNLPAADLENPVPDSNSVPDDKALRGGVTWGFESKNIYNAVMRVEPGKKNPESPSDATELRDLRFSSLGGWGHVKAGFDNKRSTISGEVTMGSTQLYKLERIGRIGVWWNRAKHVIVYKRTVLPSKQMEKFQNPLYGRPIIRKVEEYIEILEPRREYPDGRNAQTSAMKTLSGFVNACSFTPGARFNVLSSWGTDVGNLGWKIPLWKPFETPADLYPKPKVYLEMHTEADGKATTIPCAIAEPENVYFYTDTREKTSSNPDDWEPIQEVDFVNLPLAEPLKDFTEGENVQTTPDDPSVHPGYSPCTFKLDPAPFPVDISANRGGKPMFTELATVTMMRAKPTGSKTKDWKETEAPHEKLILVREKTAGAFQELLRLLPKKEEVLKSLDSAQLTQLKNEIKQKVEAPLGSFKKIEGELQNTANGIKEKISGIGGTIEAQRLALTEKIIKAERAVFRNIEKQLIEKTNNAQGVVTKLQEEFDELIKRAEKDADQWNTKRKQFFQEARQKFRLLQEGLRVLFIPRGTLPIGIKRSIDTYQQLIDDSVKEATEIQDFLLTLPDNIQDDQLRELKIRLGEIIATYDRAKRVLQHRVFGNAFDWLPQVSDAEMFSNLRKEFEKPINRIVVFLEDSKRSLLKSEIILELEAIKSIVSSPVYAIFSAEKSAVDKVVNSINDRVKRVLDMEFESEQAKSWIFAQWELINNIPDTATIDQFKAEIKKFLENIDIANKPENCKLDSPNLFGQLHCIEQLVVKETEDRIKYVFDSVNSVFNEFNNPLKNLADQIGNLGNEQLKNLRKEVEKIRDEYVKKAEAFVSSTINSVVPQLNKLTPPKELYAIADSVPRLIRAFGQPPEVPNLEFKRKEVAFFYNEVDKAIGITPVISKVRQAGMLAGEVRDALQPLGIDLPTEKILEELIPPSLKDFKLSEIFPKFAGLDLTDLFSGIKLPDLNNDKIKVSHGVDPQSRRAWTEANINVNIAQDCPVFTIGMITLVLKESTFDARMRFEASPEGVRRIANGKIFGKWELIIGGMSLVTFKETTLSFDDSGGFRFNISPLNVELTKALSFVSEFLNKFSDPDSGFSVGLTPTGVRAILHLPIPPVRGGTSGMSNLSLGVAFGVEFAPDFAISLSFQLARKEAPFNLIIFVLGGGGYVEVKSLYVPSKKVLSCTVEIGITVSASLGIALGPISGSVEIFLGVNVRFAVAAGDSNTGLKVGLMLLIKGEVSVLGIVSASISLLLEAEYESGQLIARGTFSIKVKISWCYTLKVRKKVQYRLGGKKTSSLNSAPVDNSVADLKGKSLQKIRQAEKRTPRYIGASYQPNLSNTEIYSDGSVKYDPNSSNSSAKSQIKAIDYKRLATNYVDMVN